MRLQQAEASLCEEHIPPQIVIGLADAGLIKNEKIMRERENNKAQARMGSSLRGNNDERFDFQDFKLFRPEGGTTIIIKMDT